VCCLIPNKQKCRRTPTITDDTDHTGKTTLLNVLAGQVPASPSLALTGRLFVNGHALGKSGAEHSQVGEGGDGSGVKGWHTVFDPVLVGAARLAIVPVPALPRC